MADATVYIKVEFEIVLLRELSHFFMVGCTLHIRTGRIMIKNKSAAGIVPHFFSTHLIKRVDGLKVQIVDLGKVDLGHYDFPCVYHIPAAVLSKYFFYCVHRLPPK